MKDRRSGRSRVRVPEIVRTASLLVSCVECGRLHKPQCPLDLNPVCPGCTGGYTMESLAMGACHALTDQKIDEEVTRTSAGTYVLGYMDGGTFIPFYVGRSDSDVKARLRSWVGVDSRSSRFGPTAQAAYGSRPRRFPWSATPSFCPVGVVVDGRYTHFVFGYAPSAEAAFEQECQNYHDFGGSYGLDNERHPVPPEGVGCPEDLCT